MKRITLYLVGLVLICSVFLPLMAAVKVEAAGNDNSDFTFAWVNEATFSATLKSTNIKYTFYDPSGIQDHSMRSSGYDFFDTDPVSSMCSLYLTLQANSDAPAKSINGSIDIKNSSGTCTTYTISNASAGDTGNADIVYTISGNTISRVDGSPFYTFTQTSSNSDEYLENNYNGSYVGTCLDVIEYTAGGPAQLRELNSGQQSYSYSAGGRTAVSTTKTTPAVAASDAAGQTGCYISINADDINGPSMCGGLIDDGTLPPQAGDCDSAVPGSPCENFGLDSGSICSDYSSNSDGSYTISVGTQAANSSPGQTGTASGSAGSGSTQPTCENSGGILSWITCPIINGIIDAVNGINDDIVKPMLKLPLIALVNNTSGESKDYQVWSNFRIYGNIVLVIALLILVFGEVIGGGVVDAYTAKKMLPRILIGAILINLSIYIVAALIDVSNVLGSGIGSLISAPFSSVAGANQITLSGLTSGLFLAAGGASIWAFAALAGTAMQFIALFVLVPALLAFLGILVTILIRQGLVIFLVMTSPIAFALYCLPNTEHYFKKWWDLLFRTIMIYPIVEVMFALSFALAVTINSTASGLAKPLVQLMSLAALVMPLFLIPFAFKIAGGVLGQISEVTANLGKRAAQGIQGNPNDPNSLGSRVRTRLRMRQAEKSLTGAALNTRLNPANMITSAGRERRKQNLAARREADRTRLGASFLESDAIVQANKNNDQFLLALARPDLAQANMDKEEDATKKASWGQAIAAARQVHGAPAVRMAAAQALSQTGFQWSEGQEGYNELAETMAMLTGADLVRDANGNVTGATGDHAGAYANAMDNAQFSLKNAGRWEFGGINRGAGWDLEGGLGKADPYTLATRAKPQAIKAKGLAMRQAIARAMAAQAAGDTKTFNEEMERAEVHNIELKAALDINPTGVNRDAIVQELGSVYDPETGRAIPGKIERDNRNREVYVGGGDKLDEWRKTPSTQRPQQQTRRVNYVEGMVIDDTPVGPRIPGSWTREEAARGWRMENIEIRKTNGDVAREHSRGTRIPNPQDMEET
jgi:hypothetical protein